MFASGPGIRGGWVPIIHLYPIYSAVLAFDIDLPAYASIFLAVGAIVSLLEHSTT